jgi:hypothetical protein
VSSLKYQWIGKNVAIDKLVNSVEVFFSRKDFRVSVDRSEGGYRIIAVSNFRVEKAKIVITVEVLGEADDVTMEFNFQGNMPRVWMISSLTSLFGGNWFLLHSLRIKDRVEKIERDFWACIDGAIAHRG